MKTFEIISSLIAVFAIGLIVGLEINTNNKLTDAQNTCNEIYSYDLNEWAICVNNLMNRDAE